MYLGYFTMQLFSFGYILVYGKFIEVFEGIKDIFLILATLGAMLFAFGFNDDKIIPEVRTQKSLFIYTIFLVVAIVLSIYHYILFEYLPYSVIYFMLFVFVIFNFQKGFKPTVIYVIGWSLLIFFMFLLNLKQEYMIRFHLDIVMLAFGIEALLFAIAVSHKDNATKNKADDYQKMLLQQSKLAQSGEMIANITHQFRQPLNSIAYILLNIKRQSANCVKIKDSVSLKIDMANQSLQFLSKTIDAFKDFYLPSKNKETFSVLDAVNSAYVIISAEIKNKNINFTIKCNADLKVYGIKSELAQVFLALISNSIYAVLDNEIKNIDISIYAKDKNIIAEIKDNGKGILQSDLNKIFMPYFSTKDSGFGIGLYLVKLIIEQGFNGKIKAENQTDGALFSICLNSID